MDKEEKANPIYAKVTVELNLTHEAIVNILSNGFFVGCTGFDDVDYDHTEYGKAKKALIAEGFKDLCLEDVQAKMLAMGYSLKLHMLGEPGNKEWYELTLDKLVRGIEKYAEEPVNGSVMDVLGGDPNANLDAIDYDTILQYACFGKVLIG